MFRRLLISGANGGSFTPAAVLDITTSPDGGWAIPNPSAYADGGYIYHGWVPSLAGNHVRFAVYDEWNTAETAPMTIASGLADDSPGGYDLHDNPSCLVDSVTRHLIVAYCGHEDTRMRVRVSVNSIDSDPLLTGGFGSEQVLNLGASFYTYPTLIQLRGVAGSPIFLFYRDMTNNSPPTTARLAFSTSTDGGATWAAQTRILTGAANLTPYWEIGSDWSTRIDVAITNTSPNGSTQTISHFYISGGLYYKSDGTQITATLPFATSDCTSVLGTGHASFPGGIVSPASMIYMVVGSSDYAVKAARFRSGSWVTTTILASVGGTPAANAFLPGCALDPFDENLVWAGVKSGSFYELYRYVSSDDGATWVETAVTSGSSEDQFFVEPVTFGSGIKAMWLNGAYTGDTNYSFGIRLYRG